MTVDKEKLDRLYQYINAEIERLSPDDRQHLSANSLKSFQSLILSQGIDAYRGFDKIQRSLRPNEKQKYQIIEFFLNGIRKEFKIEDKTTFSTYIGYAARISAYTLLAVDSLPSDEGKTTKSEPKKKNDNGRSIEKAQSSDSHFAEVLKASLDKNRKNKAK